MGIGLPTDLSAYRAKAPRERETLREGQWKPVGAREYALLQKPKRRGAYSPNTRVVMSWPFEVISEHSQITVNMHMRAFGILKVLFNFKVAASQVSCCTATVAVDICPVRGIIQSVPSQKKKRK